MKCNSRSSLMTSSVTLPEVVEKYPRSQKRLPRKRLRRSGSSIWNRRDGRPLMRCMTSDRDSSVGIERNIVGMVEALFKQFDGYPARQGYIAWGGQVLGSSIVPVQKNNNMRDEKDVIKNGKVPNSSIEKTASQLLASYGG